MGHKILYLSSLLVTCHQSRRLYGINPWHREEEPHNNHKTPGRQTKQSNQLSLHHRGDCKTGMDTKYRTAKHRTITDSQRE